MKKLLIVATVVVLVVLLLVPVSCAQTSPEEGAPSAPTEPSSGVPPVPTAPPGGEEEYRETGTSGLPSTDEERMIVRTGEMSLVVEDVIQARDEIAQLAVGFGGYVVSSQISGEEQDRRGWISIRVPDEKFDQALSELRELAVRVESEGTDSRDVTEEYVDLQSRLKNAEATESQYLALLEKAITVEDILRIYDSLSRVRMEIEQIKGRMQYLERTSSMSSITVRLEPEATAKPLVRAGWNALEILKSAVRGLATFGQVLGTIILWLLIFIPVWGTILGIILWRLRRKRSKAKDAL